ncbi:hypothetical protein HYS00_02935 [Candidatus Microgenomates bacterium]|nr:hypothetical protein [Candidatus Microgenomates bacterium]
MAKKAKRSKAVAKRSTAPVHHREKASDHSAIMQIGIAFIIIAALLLMFYVGQNYSIQ